jgi:glycosyltransferase involved in cell wall biosynthesis
LVPVVRRLFAGPIIFDAYLSNFDTLCLDRKLFAPHSPPGRLAWNLDRWAGLSGDMITLDTRTQAEYFQEAFGLEEGKVCHIYLGAEEDIFWPRSPLEDRGAFRVLFYGSFQPLHGIETILRAAHLVGPEAEFTILGRGAEYPRMRRLAESLELENVRFHPSTPYRSLPTEIARTSVCLGGPFGTSPKVRRVITSKTYQALAMAKPVVVGDTPANREIMAPRREAMMVPLGDAGALAETLLELKKETSLRQQLAENGYRLFRSSFTTERTSQRIRELVGAVV